MFSFKNLLRILIDLGLLALAFVLATLIRLEFSLDTTTAKFIFYEQIPQILGLIVALKFLALLASGTYKKFWRYTDSKEIIQLAATLLIPTVMILAPRLTGMSPQAGDIWAISFGIGIIDYFISLAFLAGVRLLRFYLVQRRDYKRRAGAETAELKRTLVIGAGEAGVQTLKAIQQHPELGLQVIAALDDDKRKHGMEMGAGVTVRGPVEELKFWVQELEIHQVIVAIPSLARDERREINLLANDSGADVRVIPGVDQLAGGQVTVEQIRKLSMEDLLGRDAIDLHLPEVVTYLKGKRVLVTGAGGSIGSELCRQLISQCEIDSMCLLGKGENSVFNTLQDLKQLCDEQDLPYSLSADGEISSGSYAPVIADIKNASRIEHVIKTYKPDVIFHAAAHKHVYLMELNACEAFENNVIGTRTVAELAGKHGVASFVLISTDKAVNPSSIMGATKSLAEKMVLWTSTQYPETKYTAVRFGNVLGSRGSVIQVWEKQLRAGQALTVTHKDAIRYFMTIPEASQLVIQAAARAQNGEIMVLDMGTPIKIYELAQQFIKLAGFAADEVPIDIIGLREGEKLYEELLTDSEQVESQLAEKIFKAKLEYLSEEEQAFVLSTLLELAANNQNSELKKEIRRFVNTGSLNKV